jgi:hypothetical protein
MMDYNIIYVLNLENKKLIKKDTFNSRDYPYYFNEF